MHCKIFPGKAPMYVRRWPRISASSWTPPKERLRREGRREGGREGGFGQ